MIGPAPLEAAPAWAYSSVVEHCVDIAGVASSILATPTIKNPANPMGWRGFYMTFLHRQTPSTPPYAQQNWANQSSFGQILGTKIRGMNLFGPRLGTSAPSILKPIIAAPSRSMATAGLTVHWVSGVSRSLASVGFKARDVVRKTIGWAIWQKIALLVKMMWRDPRARSWCPNHRYPMGRHCLLRKSYLQGSRCKARNPPDGCAGYFVNTKFPMSVSPVKCAPRKNNSNFYWRKLRAHHPTPREKPHLLYPGLSHARQQIHYRQRIQYRNE